MDEQQAETLTGAEPRPGGPRTPDVDEGPLGELDTARLRNAIARRVFGETIDPIRIGRYPILRRIGQGGMGVVYAAYDNELERRIAIKLLRRGDGEDEAEGARMRARMLREARALAQLSDPSIVQIYEAGEHDGHVFLAMEFVEGPTLRQWLEAERRGVAEILAVFAQAGRGLAAAHAAGLVHRDFKPDNVIIGADGRVRVLDFGVALTTRAPVEVEAGAPLAANDDARLTATGAMVGTPAYMAPEQMAGRIADARSDQFSFAVALFEALHHQRPYVGGSVTELIAATLTGRIEVPVGRRVAPRVNRALRRALARDPEQRYASMAALLHDLGAHTRALRWLAVGAVAATLGTAGWIGVRAGELADEAAVANVRADEAELQLLAREAAIVVGEANIELFRDPTAALAKLAELPDDAEVWNGAAWQVAARAIDDGVADRVLPVPAGFEVRFMVDERTAIVGQLLDHAVWHLDNGLVDVIDPGFGNFVEFSTGGTWAAIIERDALRVRHLATGVEGRWDLAGCEASVFASDDPVLVMRCSGGDDYSLAWSVPTGPDDPPSFRRSGPSVFVGPADLRRSAARLARDAADRAIERRERISDTALADVGDRRFDLLSQRGQLAARVERSHIRAVDPLVLWDLVADRGRTVELAASPVTARFSPSGAQLAVGVNDGGIWLVDLRDPALPARSFAKLDSGVVEHVAFSRDGTELCGIGNDGTIVRWDLAGREELARVRGPVHPHSCFWHADGSFAVLAAEEYRHYPAPTLRRIDEDVLRVDAAGDELAVLRRSGAIDVVGGGELIHVGRHIDAEELALSPEGRLVATSGERWLELRALDGTIRERIQTRDQAVRSLAFTPKGDTLVWLDRNQVQIHDLGGGEHRSVPTPGEGFWRSLLPDGDALVAAYGPGEGAPAELVTIDIARGEINARVSLPKSLIRALVPLADGTIAAVHDGSELLLLERDGTVRATLRETGPVLLDLVAIDGGRGLATLDMDGTLDIWDTRTGLGYATPLAAGHGTAIHGGRHRLDHDATVAVGGDGTLWVADRTGALVRYRIETPWPGRELAAWVRSRSVP